jgi:hypothetical protein
MHVETIRAAAFAGKDGKDRKEAKGLEERPSAAAGKNSAADFAPDA